MTLSIIIAALYVPYMVAKRHLALCEVSAEHGKESPVLCRQCIGRHKDRIVNLLVSENPL